MCVFSFGRYDKRTNVLRRLTIACHAFSPSGASEWGNEKARRNRYDGLIRMRGWALFLLYLAHVFCAMNEEQGKVQKARQQPPNLAYYPKAAQRAGVDMHNQRQRSAKTETKIMPRCHRNSGEAATVVTAALAAWGHYFGIRQEHSRLVRPCGPK